MNNPNRVEIASRSSFLFSVVSFILWLDILLNGRLHSSMQSYGYFIAGCVFLAMSLALRLYNRPRKTPLDKMIEGTTNPPMTKLPKGKLTREAFGHALSEHFAGDLNENDLCPFRVSQSLMRVAGNEFNMPFAVQFVTPILIRDVIDSLYQQYLRQ